MLKARTLTVVALLGLLALSLPAQGRNLDEGDLTVKLGDIDVTLDGWYRARGAVFSFSEDGYNQADYLDHRLRLEVDLTFGENIELHSELSALDGVLWGNQGPTGNILTQTPTDTGHSSPFTLNNDEDYQEQDDFNLKRLYLRVRTPVGLLQVGRQPSKWGLGILANDGNQLDDLQGDTYDRILFLTKPLDPFLDGPVVDNIYLAALYSQIVEGDTNFLGDDVREIVVAPFYTDDLVERNNFLGLYILYRHASTGDILTSDGDALLVDVYWKWKFLNDQLTVEFEALYGEATTDVSIGGLLPDAPVFIQEADPSDPTKFEATGSAFNFYLKTRYDENPWYLQGEMAGQIGSDEDQVQLDIDLGTQGLIVAGDSYSLPIDSDLHFDHIMFREAYAAITEITPLPFDDSNGGISNAFVLRLSGGYEWILGGEFPLELSGSLVYGSVIETDAFATNVYSPVDPTTPVRTFSPSSSDLGFEIDVEAYLTMYERFKFGLILGYWAPGGFFDDMREAFENPDYAFGYYQVQNVMPYTEDSIWTAQMRFFVLL